MTNTLVPHEQRGRTLTSLELFAGPGGLALGLHRAGFKHLGLVEWNAFAAETLRHNRALLGIGEDAVIEKDARDVDFKPYAGKVDLLCGGPPYQPFSSGGRGHGAKDPRNMFPAFCDALATIMPKAILVENVRGLPRPIFKDYFDYILRRFQFPLVAPWRDETWEDHYKRLSVLSPSSIPDEEQFVVTHQVLDAANHGIPQRRERVLISAFRRDLQLDTFSLAATHDKTALLGSTPRNRGRVSRAVYGRLGYRVTPADVSGDDVSND